MEGARLDLKNISPFVDTKSILRKLVDITCWMFKPDVWIKLSLRVDVISKWLYLLVLNFPRSHPFCRQRSSFPVGPGGMTDITHNGLSFRVRKKMKAVVCLETPHHSHKAGNLCSCCWSRLTAFMVCLSEHEPKKTRSKKPLN